MTADKHNFEVYHFGGAATLAVAPWPYKEDQRVVALALVMPGNTFNRKRGRTIATGRIHVFINEREKRFRKKQLVAVVPAAAVQSAVAAARASEQNGDLASSFKANLIQALFPHRWTDFKERFFDQWMKERLKRLRRTSRHVTPPAWASEDPPREKVTT